MAGSPHLNSDLRRSLLECYLDASTSTGLSAWLQDIGQDTRGSMDEKRQRVRDNTKYLSMPAADFPAQTLHYLAPLSADHLAAICEALGISAEGNKDDLHRRIFREVGLREGWLDPLPDAIEGFTKELVLPYIEWYPVRRRFPYERDYYEAFDHEMLDLFGEEHVHPEYPVAHGSTLKIDFHIGRPQQPGVGVEFKRPANNSEIQRALGQMDQYLSAYGTNLIVVLFPDDLSVAQRTPFVDTLRSRGITTVVKEVQ